MVQAAAMVYAIAGLGIWVDRDGGVLDKAAFESGESLFPEMVGLMVHGMNGMMVIPLLAGMKALLLFFLAVWAGKRVPRREQQQTPQAATADQRELV